MSPDGRGRTAAVVLLATIGVVLAGPGSVAADHGSPGNWTVVPGDPQPGANGVDYKHFAVGQAAWDGTHEGRGLQKADYMVLTWDEGSFADCTLFNAEAFGFDRGNDDPGTDTDDFAGTYVEDFAMEEDVMWMDFHDEDDAGPTTHFDRNDQFVAHQTGCYQNPDAPGWYRVFGWMNGTDYAGSFARAELYSHYFYICDCGSYDEAVDEMGAPPSQAQETPTPTPTPTATAAGEETVTEADATETRTVTPPEGGTQTAGAAEPTTTTAAAGDGGARSPTQTAGDGPGFSAIGAVAALFAAGLLAIRRR